MEERKANNRTILCKCGHPLGHHSSGAGECYASTRKTEKKKNHIGQEVKVKCVYCCHCKKFEFDEDGSQTNRNTHKESEN